MSSYQDVDGSAFSQAGRKPKRCGICYKDFTRHFERHFKKAHPKDQLCIARWVGGTDYMIVPLKEKRPDANIIIEEQPNID